VKITRFVADVGADLRVRIEGPGGASIAAERTMRRVTSRDGDFPMPAAPVAAGEPHRDLCADGSGALAAQLYERVVERCLDPGDVERYGRWLFDALLGDESFAAIASAAASAGADLVEIALRWPASELSLARLHWEAMRSRTGFLAAGKGPRVAVTRLVNAAAWAPTAMASPPRVLFVLGGSAGEEGLRPGAELLGVLRPQRSADRSLRGEVLAAATPRRLRAAMARASPDVVHLIAHGVVDRGNCSIDLASDEGETDSLRSADQLLAMLRHPGGLPKVMLLSVCDSGLALPLSQTGSLASELVAKGVPIVVGMAGRVSNVACRLFARRFGEALLTGEPLIAATEEGRRAAFAEGERPDRTIDWALPALFLSEGVPPDFGARPAPEDPLEKRVAAYKIGSVPVFCGRHEVFDAMHDVLSKKTHPVLAIVGRESSVGRTRALKEVTAAALRAGHVPCLLLWESPAAVVPTSIKALAIEIGKAIGKTRAAFRLAPRAPSQIALLINSELDALRCDARLPAALLEHLAFATEIDARAFALAIADDLTALARDARAADAASSSPVLHAQSRAMLLVDDVHRWDKALEPFLDVLVSAWGLGTEQEPVPVVLTFPLDSPAAALLRPIAERRRQGWSTVQLDRFGEGEDVLAYQQVLLHPFGPVLPKFSDLCWAFDFDIDRSVVVESVEALRETIAGSPGKLGEREFYAVARALRTSRFVVPAGDEHVLEKLRGGGAP
jgi:hypothetical protein